MGKNNYEVEDLIMKVLKEIKYLLIRVFKFFYQTYYFILTFFNPIDENKVVIALYRTKTLEGNLKFIHDEIIKQNQDAKIHLIFSENKMNLKLFIDLFAFRNAKYLVLDDYFLPIYLINPRKSLKVIQLWHAAGAFKKFGYSSINKSFGADISYLNLVPIHSNYTHVYVSSKNAVPHYSEAFNMSEERVFPLGVPRTDMFYNEKEKKRVSEKINNNYQAQISNKVVVLFAPTYRANKKQKESDVDFVEILYKASQALKRGKVIVYKPHPYMTDESLLRLKKCENIIIATQYSVNEWMLVSDAFVTDYSSAIFEYAILQKPMAHFVPDFLEYEAKRGLYYPVEEISDGEILEDYSALINWMNSRTKDEFWDTERMMAFNFSNVQDSSEKITRHFLS